MNEDGTKIRRQSTDPLPTIGLLSPETRKEIKSRTLHIVSDGSGHNLHYIYTCRKGFHKIQL